MATTTSNFGWDIPQSTDLVKDGATAIATLGQDIDTSMADLKGGTTGQVLSKTSNTDMDFTWVAPTTGDITGVTAGTGLTGGGTSGDVTVSFDVANYGGGQYAAGKNKIINGDFGIWQRGTSINWAADGQYYADRWCWFVNGTGRTSINVSAQSFTPGTAPVSGYEGVQFARLAQSTAGTGATYSSFLQYIEQVQTFAGQTVTVSFWAKAASNTTLGVQFEQNFGSGGSAAVTTTATSSVSVTTSWQRFNYTVTLPSIAGKTIGTSSKLGVTFNMPQNATFTVDIWGVQLEAGSTATPFQTATGTKQGELAACQRYYYRISTATNYNLFAAGNASSSTNAYIQLIHPVTLRVAATAVEYSNLAVGFVGGTPNAVTNLVLDSASASTLRQNLTTTVASGLTTNSYYTLLGNNSSSAYLGISAEL